MKLASFRAGARTGWGVTDGATIVDMHLHYGERWPSVRAVLAAGALAEVGRLAAARRPDHRLDEIALLPPVTDPDMIICVGMNYHSAFAEIDRTFPGRPSLFTRRISAQVGHGQPLQKPVVSEQYDCEVELAAIIGTAGRNIAAADALAHVAGWSVFNDASVVDWMRHTTQNVTAGKNFEASGAFGPFLVTAYEVGDPTKLRLVHRLNGALLQDGPVTDMCFSIPEQIAYISTFTTLLPGDVISTGSPGGIRSRRQANVWLKAGDVVEMEIPGVGTLRNTVA